MGKMREAIIVALDVAANEIVRLADQQQRRGLYAPGYDALVRYEWETLADNLRRVLAASPAPGDGRE